MNLKSIIEPHPILMTLIPTHKCSAACDGCCFGCTPKIKHQMSYEEMVFHVDSAITAYPSIRVLVISGGECTLLGDDLDKIIAYGTQRGLRTRIVSNASWAKSYDDAYYRMMGLVKAGLCEFNVSTGKQHQKFVPLQNIIYAILAANNLGISPVQIAYERHPEDSQSSIDFLRENETISHLLKDGKIEIIDGIWQNLKNPLGPEIHGINFCKVGADFRCRNLYNYITINPYSQLLACCGLTQEYNPYLKLGDLRKKTITDLYDSQFEELFFLWLYTMGPKHIYEKIAEYKGIQPKPYSHPCIYCIEIVNDKENIPILEKLVCTELPIIL